MIVKLTGEVFEWRFGIHSRKFSTVVLPYHQMSLLCKSYVYDAHTDQGEQRDIFPAHLRKIKGDIMEGRYTPTPISLGVHPEHAKAIEWKGSKFSLEVPDDSPLPLTDGGHRMGAIGALVGQFKEEIENGEESQKEFYRGLLKDALELPIEATIYLDGDTRMDFKNLQAGRPIDKAHMATLQLRSGDEAEMMAFEVCEILNDSRDSPFRNIIRFDSHKEASGATLKKIPVSTFCARSSGDLSTSAIGLAKVALSFEKKAKDAAGAVLGVFRHIEKHAKEELLVGGKCITPPTLPGGTRGSATMIIGIGLVWLYLQGATLKKKPSNEDWELLLSAARDTLDVPIEGGFTSADKRRIMGEFARIMLNSRGEEEEMSQGVPRGLIKLTSMSAWGVRGEG